MSFQENLKYYREKAGYKQAKDFAKVLDIPYSTYIGYEVRNREPKYQTLCKIADLLNVSTDELLGRTSNILGNNEDTTAKIIIDNLLKKDDKITPQTVPIRFQLKNIEDNTLYFDLVPTNTSMSVDKAALIEFINSLDIIKSKTFQDLLRNMYFSSMWIGLKQPISEDDKKLLQTYNVKTYVKNK